MNKNVSLCLGFVLCAGLPCLASAQAFPAKTIRIIIGVPPGGFSDNLARGLSAELTKTWGQPVVIENRVGASDAIAAETAAKSPADGHTIYQANGTLLMVNQLLRKNLPFDVERDFAPVHALVRTSDVLVARNGLGVKSVRDLVALAKSKPGALNYGSIGVGSGPHLSSEKLNVAAGISTTHIPYKGGADIGKGLLGGEIDYAFSGLGSIIGLIRQGQMQALAWGAPERSPAIPNVPTLNESGYAFDTGSFLGWLVPTATPRAVTDRISADVSRALALPGIREKFIIGQGLEPLNLPPAQFAALMKETRAAYAALFSKIDIRLD